MAWICVFYVLFAAFQPFVTCKPASPLRDGDAYYSVEYEKENRTKCGEMEVIKWESDFHDCFMKRKYNDGGEDLDSIVDRILEHAETCVEKSKKDCQPDSEGFEIILGKVLEQMKDYCSMYLESIVKGRENVRDLTCVEETLSLPTYERCFEPVFRDIHPTQDEFQNGIREGLSCANKGQWGCSRDAKTSLNRIVRTVLGMKHPSEEYVEEDEPSTTPAPPEMAWYDYIFQPFVSAWNWVKSIFG